MWTLRPRVMKSSDTDGLVPHVSAFGDLTCALVTDPLDFGGVKSAREEGTTQNTESFCESHTAYQNLCK